MKLKLEESNEPSWELMRYCLEFLEENSQDWAKRKRLREQEQQRQERLEKAKRKQVKTQMNIIEKKIQEGLELLPRETREKLEREEMKRNKLELQSIKSSLWKLKSREKKFIKNSEFSEKITGMTEKWKI